MNTESENRAENKEEDKVLSAWRQALVLPLRRGRKALPMVLMVGGAALLFYVAAQYATMWHQQRTLARQWSEQQLQTRSAASAAAVNDGLTRVRIPSIGLDAVVVEGTSHRALLIGPGHVEETALPGDTGNVVITAHRDPFFRHLTDLNQGDVIALQRNGQLYRYEVTGKRVVGPTDVSVLKPSTDHRLTLITCYPTYYIGPAPERLVVFSKMTSPENTAKAAEGADSMLQPAAQAK